MLSRNLRAVTALLASLAAASGCSLPDAIGPRPGFEALPPRLTARVEPELIEKEIPALSLAVVDRHGIVWAAGFGFAEPETEVRATASTVYRVGSVSKLFTDLALMQLVDKGELELEAPVQQYLPDFRPGPLPGGGPGAETITLAQLVSHRAGIVRESPVGNYFDPTEPSLEDTVASLNSTSLVYAPGTRKKYSNAGISVVGRVIEVTQGVSFEEYVREHILEPLGMSSTSFGAEPELRARLARAQMWSYDGREFEAPTFQLGTGPAGNLSSSVADMSRFISMLLCGGCAPDGSAILPRETLERMWVPLADPAAESGFGVGFFVSRFDGHRAIGHNGAVYGHSTVLKVLPDVGVGVIAVASMDIVNGVVQRIAEDALRCALVPEGKAPAEHLAGLEPATPPTGPVPRERGAVFAGTWVDGSRRIDLEFGDGRLTMDDGVATVRELRAARDGLVVDDRLGRGVGVSSLADGALRLGESAFTREVDSLPAPPPARWGGLIGEYGWDHNTLFILEKRGKLYALIEWAFSYPLEEVSENVFRFPNYGLYHGEGIVFERDASGRATKAVAAEVAFLRRDVEVASGEVFGVEPVRPIDELREIALASIPPAQPEGMREPDFVELSALDSTIHYDIRYATADNFLGSVLYESPHAFLQRPAAEALLRVHRALRERGYGLLVHDAYRPWYVTKLLADATPEELQMYVASPDRGSRHNRGCAVDLTLYDLVSGEPVEMVSGYDELTERAYADYQGGTSRQRWLRSLLRAAMEREGFSIYWREWWHFEFRGWESYPLINLRFDEIVARNAGESPVTP